VYGYEIYFSELSSSSMVSVQPNTFVLYPEDLDKVLK